MNSKIMIWFGLLIGVSLLYSCEGEKGKLDKNTRQEIETLARAWIVDNDSIIKKECDQTYEYWYQRTVDSLYKVRINEVESIRKIGLDPATGSHSTQLPVFESN